MPRAFVYFPSPRPRPGTYADVYWINEARFDVTDDYATTINTDDARTSPRGGGRARVEGGGAGLAPPRYNCTACPPGRFSNRSGVYYDGCLPCANGTFSDDPDGATTCQACSRGSYQIKPGSASCDACPVGRFMNTTGEGVVCNACPVGRSTNGESAQATCLRCSALNSQDEKDWGKLTKCNPEMACGAVGGQVRSIL
jgi:hypothetical protein